MESTEFQADLARLGECFAQERTSGLEIGRIATHWIGDARYSHVLNTKRFAQLVQQKTGHELDRKTVETYIKAYGEHEFHNARKERFEHLGVSHLAQIARCQCRDDEERIELARRANVQHASVRQIRHLAQQLHQETEQRLRVVEIEPTRCDVRVMDGLDLIREQAIRTIQCLFLDWQWSTVTWAGHAKFPVVHSPADPVGHLCSCLQAAGHKLADNGMVFLFHTSVHLLDRRVEDAWVAAGLKHAGQLIWQKACGAVMHAGTPLAIAHEHVHILCREEWAPRSACGQVSSVTPKWAAPTAVQSGRQKDAVHPHEKPVVLMDSLISIATSRGLVIDAFAGSGAGGVAAMQRGCEYRGAELVPEYAAIANRRIALATEKTEEIYEALDFMTASASDQQRQLIVRSLTTAGLSCVGKAQRQAA